MNSDTDLKQGFNHKGEGSINYLIVNLVIFHDLLLHGPNQQRDNKFNSQLYECHKKQKSNFSECHKVKEVSN